MNRIQNEDIVIEDVNETIAYNEVPTNTLLVVNGDIPHVIKYMGSKRQIIGYVVDGIRDAYSGGTVVDLFAGSSVLSGALRNQVPIISNDIQSYSAILAKTYLGNYEWDLNRGLLDKIVMRATEYVGEFIAAYPELDFNYDRHFTLEDFNTLEKAQQELIKYDFSKFKYHLFVKNYSGTYWSYEQCVWIDSFRRVAEEFKDTVYYNPIISSLMFAMSYNSQSTGHYAQYRNADNERSMDDILIYRRKDILSYFMRKFNEFQDTLSHNQYVNKVVSKDYMECLEEIDEYSTVYADPPYCFVHYSRFYHAIETLVKYDYPDVKFKGRYRNDRHQSPFCIKTKVEGAFKSMFEKIYERKSNLVLSYSNTGMIELDSLIELAKNTFADSYEFEVRLIDYEHSTMGRREDKFRSVQECLILLKRKRH